MRSEANRLLQRAEGQHTQGNTEAAIASLQAFLAVTKGNARFSGDRRRAEQMLERFTDADGSAAEARNTFIRTALGRAENLEAEGKTSDAEAIYRGLLTLYHDDPTAAELLEPARQALSLDESQEK